MLLGVQSANIFAQNQIGITELKKLYYDNKFSQVLSVIDPLIVKYDQNYKSGTDVAKELSDLYYLRGSSRFNAVYQARTGLIFDSTTIFDEKRPRFEIKYEDKAIKLLDGATSDLYLAMQIASTYKSAKEDDSGVAYWFQNAKSNIRKAETLTHLEKAQMVTNSYADFNQAKSGFSALESIYAGFSNVGLILTNPDALDNDYSNFKSKGMLAAEFRTQIALGETDNALLLFNKWVKKKGVSELKNAIPAMVEAFDMVGNYKSTEGFLVREAVRQITVDKGKIVPENFTTLKTVMKSHLANMNFAVNISPADKLLSFQRSRLASAYNIKGNLTTAESAFIKNAPDVIKADKNIPPIETQLNSVMLKLQSTDKKEKESANKTLEEMLKKDGTNAAILAVSGYAKMLSNDFKGAEIDLSAAITKDRFLAFTYKALENRVAIYKKLGKADLAAKDEKENAQFQQLLAFLAA